MILGAVQARPYPYEKWPRTTRRNVTLLRRCVPRLPNGTLEAFAQMATTLLGADMQAIPATPEAYDAGAVADLLFERFVMLVLIPPAGAAAEIVGLEVDARLASCIVDRAIGGEGGEGVPPPPTQLTRPEQGVLAYVAARLLATSSAPRFRVGTIITTLPAALAVLGKDSGVVWAARVTLGSDEGRVRLWLPERSLASPAEDGSPAIAHRATLTRIELEVVLEGARGTLSAAQVEALEDGDIIILDETWIARGSSGVTGSLRARIAGARRTTWWCRMEDGALRLDRIQPSHEPPMTKGSTMERDASTREALHLAGDAPLEITVELARFTIPLTELAALRPGEIIATGRALGEHVTLRANGRAVGTGELVDVEGEVGVRILRLGE